MNILNVSVPAKSGEPRMSKEKFTAKVGIVVGAILAGLGAFGMVTAEEVGAITAGVQGLSGDAVELYTGLILLATQLQSLFARNRAENDK